MSAELRSIVLAPALRFADLDADLSELGYQRDESVRPFTPDTLPDEPELAAWTHAEGARLTYTFHPVVALRVLSPAGMAPQECERVRAGLHALGTAELAALLADARQRQLLLGLLAVRATNARELIGPVAGLLVHSDRLVAETARSTYEALSGGGEAAARSDALRLMRVLCEQAIPVLAALKGPDAARAVETLRPQPADFARLFRADVASSLERAYRELWADPPRVTELTPNTLLEVEGCPAGMLGADNELSRRFPGGYRTLAPYLDPHRVWFVWRYILPGQSSGTRYDGLIRLDERWVWLPKPYRVLGQLLNAARN